jgi:hypothetical protein
MSRLPPEDAIRHAAIPAGGQKLGQSVSGQIRRRIAEDLRKKRRDPSPDQSAIVAGTIAASRHKAGSNLQLRLSRATWRQRYRPNGTHKR